MLRDTFVRQTKQEGRFSDGRGGNGLALIVRRRADGTLSKTWTQRLTIHGRRTNLGLGRYPVVTLAQARSLALENAQMALEGEDPRARDKVPTFRELAEKVIEGRRSRWTDAERREHRRSEHQWRRSLEMHAAPLLDRPVDVITTSEVIRALEKVWQEHPETGRRVLGRVREVMAKAVAHGHRTSNPALDAPAGLPPQPNTPVEHVPSTPHPKVGSVIAAVNASRADTATKLALEFLVLTATRTNDVRGAEWSEMDLEDAVWTIPAHRFKTRRSHRVPLSRRALEVLDEARELSGGTGLVFPGRSADGRLSDAAFINVLKRAETAGKPHGMRTSFRSWAADMGEPDDIAEMALGHVIPGVAGAYQRSDLLARRRPLMQAWADYLRAAQP